MFSTKDVLSILDSDSVTSMCVENVDTVAERVTLLSVGDLDTVTEPEPVTPMYVVNIDAVAEPVTVMSLFIHVCNLDASREAVQPSTAA